MTGRKNSQKSCEVKRERGSRGAFVQYLRRWFRVYCQNTSLHGFRYISLFDATVVESALWSAVCLAAIVFCIILMLRTWFNFSNNPLATTIDTSNPIWTMPFPGVTICNNNKVYKPHADVIAKTLATNGFDTNMSNKLFASLMKLIRPDRIEIDNATASWALDILGYTVERLMYELMQPCSKLLVRCAWLGQIYDCNKIFKMVKSNDGFCCAFNYHFDLSKSYLYEDLWLRNLTTLDEKTVKYNSSEHLPGVFEVLNTPGAGRDVGLSVALNVEAEMYKSPVRPHIGATVLIHDPLDYPDIGAHSATIQPDHVLAVSIGAVGIKSEDDVRHISLQKRMCLFDGEIEGETMYSYQTCISECMFEKVHGHCGCLPFFHPNPQAGKRTCYLTDIDCILARRQNLAAQLTPDRECDCLPQCTDKMYDVVAENVQIDDVGYDSELTRNLNAKNTSFLYVYFRDGTYLEYRKQTIMGWDGLLAAFGGIFGLCLGGSVISLVELLYHLTVEFFDFRKRKQEETRKGFPPASKMFLSMPPKESFLDRNEPSVLNKRVFLVSNVDNFHRRGPGNFRHDDRVRSNIE